MKAPVASLVQPRHLEDDRKRGRTEAPNEFRLWWSGPLDGAGPEWHEEEPGREADRACRRRSGPADVSSCLSSALRRPLFASQFGVYGPFQHG